jgi:hypothetical protein
MLTGQLEGIDNIVFETIFELSCFLDKILVDKSYYVTDEHDATLAYKKEVVFYLTDYNDSMFLLKVFGEKFNYLSRKSLKNSLRWKYPAHILVQATKADKLIISSYDRRQNDFFYNPFKTLYLCFGFPVESQFYVEL